VSWHCLPSRMSHVSFLAVVSLFHGGLVSLVTCASWFLFVEVCVTLHWLDSSKWIVERHDQHPHISSALVVIVVIVLPSVSSIGTGLLNSCVNLSTRVCL
jgi:hypothetical protein